MAYSKEEIEEKFELICKDLMQGKSVRKALMGYKMPSSETFFKWLNEDEEKAKQYARAKEIGQEALADEIIDIADDESDTYTDDFGNKRVDSAAVQKKRLQIDARKWQLSKQNPKKFGDKIDHTTGGEKISIPLMMFDPLVNETDNSTTEDIGS